ncbi:MAG: carbamoyltransferase HypF, partial [Planctomycetota bacterium]
MVKRERILISGRVQGVGFRPAVYRLAQELGLAGFIYNNTKGVTLELQGEEENIGSFLEKLSGQDKPPLAEIKSIERDEIEAIESTAGFVIKESKAEGEPVSQVSVDTATCGDCLRELKEKSDFRYRYPFINCTNCGPRYTIVKTIPYDRCNTTMRDFEMCEKCGGQYKEITDRLFHAQPVACGACGPEVVLVDNKGKVIESESDKAIKETALLLKEGKVLGIKGLGGFHLAVDAKNEEAVKRLRERKRRDHKPFAMMTASIEEIKKYANVSKEAEALLKSPQSPIVLLEIKKKSKIAKSVAEGVNTYGFMLCYTPVHHLLFGEGLDVLVMTSGNISDEPLICDNDKALERLGDVADAFLMHNRDIYRQVDDSIAHFVGGEAVLLRRARGYVPEPILSKTPVEKEIFAAGGDLKNTFCLTKGNQFICSEHIGDLEDAEVYHHYVESIEHLRGLFEVSPEVVVCDLHPGYFSTQYAMDIKDVKLIQVQHHWAHIASVLVEEGIEGPVIGLSDDGTGYGTDGTIWGCECLIASLEKFERFGHLSYYPLAGGDKASKEAIRPLMGLLKKTYGEEFDLNKFGWLLESIEPDIEKQRIILEQIEKGINVVETSSLGRVFDSVAAMAGLGSYNHFEAQLPMALEAEAFEGVDEHYEFKLDGEPVQLDIRMIIKQIVEDVQDKRESGIISAKFHNTMTEALLEMARKARDKTDLETVVLSGGVFCNRYLTNRLIEALRRDGFSVLYNRVVPSNDGGVSLGQAA